MEQRFKPQWIYHDHPSSTITWSWWRQYAQVFQNVPFPCSHTQILGKAQTSGNGRAYKNVIL